MIPNRIRASIITTTALSYGAFGWIVASETGANDLGRWITFVATWTVGLVVGIRRCWPHRSEMTK